MDTLTHAKVVSGITLLTGLVLIAVGNLLGIGVILVSPIYYWVRKNYDT